MNSITMTKNADGFWQCTLSGPHATVVINQTGSATLPSAFSPYATETVIRAYLERWNPGVEIIFA